MQIVSPGKQNDPPDVMAFTSTESVSVATKLFLIPIRGPVWVVSSLVFLILVAAFVFMFCIIHIHLGLVLSSSINGSRFLYVFMASDPMMRTACPVKAQSSPPSIFTCGHESVHIPEA